MPNSISFGNSDVAIDWQSVRAEILLPAFTYRTVTHIVDSENNRPNTDQTYVVSSGAVRPVDTVDYVGTDLDYPIASGAIEYHYTVTNSRPTRFFEGDPNQPVRWSWTETLEWTADADTQVRYVTNVLQGAKVDVSIAGYNPIGGPYQISYPDAVNRSLGSFGGDGFQLVASRYGDTLVMGADDEVTQAGAGADTIEGAGGIDEINVGYNDGAIDRVVYRSVADIGTTDSPYEIVNGLATGDLIDLSAIGGLRFIEGIAFSGRPGEVRYANETIQIDSDGDGVTDRSIAVPIRSSPYDPIPPVNETSLGSLVLRVGQATNDVVAPAIQSVSIPNAPMLVGSLVTATITVAADIDTYTMVSGSVGGFALSNFTRVSESIYTAQFTVADGGTDRAAGDPIPVSLVLQDAVGNTNPAFTTPIVQGGDPVDATRPSIVSAEYFNDTVVLTYSEALAGETANTSRPTTSMFFIVADGDLMNNVSVAVNPDARTVSVTVARSLASATNVTVSYRDPFDPSEEQNNFAAIQDVATNDALPLLSYTVTRGAIAGPTPGSDVLTIGPSDPVTLDALGGDDRITVTGGVHTVIGGDGNDVITAAASLSALTAQGGAGSDTLTGGSAADVLDGGAGTDNLSGGQGNDLLMGGADGDALYGGAGDDSLFGGQGGDLLSGGSGYDYARYDQAAAGVVVRLDFHAGSGGEAAGDLIGDDVEGIIGSDFADTLIGDGQANVIAGNGGDDVILGQAGADTLLGGAGADALYGGDGDDSLFGGLGGDIIAGGAGYDYLRYDGASAGVVVRLDFHAGYSGEAAGDLIGDDVEGIIGTDFADTLIGDGQANLIVGNGGADAILGGGGADSLVGGAGADALLGGAGPDVLVGGDDADAFYFAAADNVVGQFDVIADFQDGLDRIYLQGWNPATLAATQAFGNTYLTTLDSGYTTGVIVANATLAQVLDQVVLI